MNQEMDAEPSDSGAGGAGDEAGNPEAKWGPWIFAVALAMVVAFFWWLTIAGHG